MKNGTARNPLLPRGRRRKRWPNSMPGLLNIPQLRLEAGVGSFSRQSTDLLFVQTNFYKPSYVAENIRKLRKENERREMRRRPALGSNKHLCARKWHERRQGERQHHFMRALSRVVMSRTYEATLESLFVLMKSWSSRGPINGAVLKARFSAQTIPNCTLYLSSLDEICPFVHSEI